MQESPLAKKLGLKPGMTVLVSAAPPEFSAALGRPPEGCRLVRKPPAARVDAVIAFVRSRADVPAASRAAVDAIIEDGLLWFAYPKKSGPLKTDISRDAGWEPLAQAGYDSVAQVAVDATWTGFRWRRLDRIQRRPR